MGMGDDAEKKDSSLTNFILNLLSHCRDVVEQGQGLVHAFVDHTEVCHNLLEDDNSKGRIFAKKTVTNKIRPPHPNSTDQHGFSSLSLSFYSLIYL